MILIVNIILFISVPFAIYIIFKNLNNLIWKIIWLIILGVSLYFLPSTAKVVAPIAVIILSDGLHEFAADVAPSFFCHLPLTRRARVSFKTGAKPAPGPSIHCGSPGVPLDPDRPRSLRLRSDMSPAPQRLRSAR